MHLTMMQRVYFVAAAAPLLVAAFFGGRADAVTASSLACSLEAPRAAGATATQGESAGSGSYGY